VLGQGPRTLRSVRRKLAKGHRHRSQGQELCSPPLVGDTQRLFWPTAIVNLCGCRSHVCHWPSANNTMIANAIQGRRRIRLCPLAMLNMAFGQKRQEKMNRRLTDLIRNLLTNWTGPLPTLCYVTDAGRLLSCVEPHMKNGGVLVAIDKRLSFEDFVTENPSPQTLSPSTGRGEQV
jgi:hypothetical protein